MTFLFSLNAQEITALKEPIVSLDIGMQATKVSFASSDEGFLSAGSPFIDRLGQVIFYNAIGDKRFIIINGKIVTSIPYKGNLDSFRIQGNRFIKSQQGLLFDGQVQEFFYNDQLFEYRFDTKGVDLVGSGYNNYPAPWGAILYSEKQKTGIAIVIDIGHPSKDFSLIPQLEIKSWLPNQPGGFSIGDDGLLYRNGMLWSAASKPKYGIYAYSYLGRLMSGHVLWSAGNQSPEQFVVTDTRGNVEIVINLPWAAAVENEHYQYNYGLGPWGELYMLLPPPFKPSGLKGYDLDGGEYDYYLPDSSLPAELVVVRNHLKYFGRLNADRVRLRKEPNTTSDIVGTYPNKTGFRILETSTTKETIAGQTAPWIKVRLLDGMEGWFFGAFVHNLYDGPDGNPPPWPNVADW